MKKNVHITSSAKVKEVPAIIIGVAAATIISALLTVGLTSLVMNGTISEAGAGSYIFIIRAVASASGCFVGAMLIKGKYLFTAGTVAAGYLAVLAGMGIIFYEGSFNNIPSAAASVLLGSLISCLVVLKPLKKPKHSVRYGR